MKTSMKRALLGTTAVVGLGLLIPAPVFAAEPMSLSIDGTVTIQAYYVNQDDESRFTGRGTHLEVDDGGFNLKAKGEADNGLVYGAKIEIDTDISGALAIDEQMVYFSGGWGRLELGNEDGAEDVMYTSGGSLAVGSGGMDGDFGDVFDVNGVQLANSNITDSGDSTKITYFTPRINGFQIGVTYAPDTGADATDSLRANAEDGDDQEDFVGLGMNFVQTFDDVTVRLAAVFATARTETVGTEDIGAYAIGAKVDFGDFSVAAGYGDDGDSAEEGTVTDKVFFDIGASYSNGPYSFSVGYFNSEASTDTDPVTADTEFDVIALGVAYSVAPGLSVYAEYFNIDVDKDGTGDGADNDGNVFLIGTTMSF